MKIFQILCLLLCFLPNFLMAEPKVRIIYKYKKYDAIDLGSLEIKGNIIAPGDLTVKDKQRKVFDRDIYERYNFDPETIEDLKSLR